MYMLASKLGFWIPFKARGKNRQSGHDLFKAVVENSQMSDNFSKVDIQSLKYVISLENLFRDEERLLRIISH